MSNPFSVATGGGFNDGFNSVVDNQFKTNVTDSMSGFDDFDFSSIGSDIKDTLGGVGNIMGGLPGFSDSSSTPSGGTIGNGNKIDFTGGSINFAKSAIPLWLLGVGGVACYFIFFRGGK